MNDTAPWTCPTCQRVLSTPYCPTCGERQLHPRDLTLRGLLAQIAQAITNLDARLIRTVRCLVTRPGELTIRYLQGQRKPYIGPIAFFLLTNVLFVGMESLTQSNVFSTPLEQHVRNQPWSAWARPLVAHRLTDLRTTFEAYAPVFDAAVADLAGAGRLHDRLDHRIHLIVGDRDLELDLRQEVDDVLRPAVQLSVALLAAEALHLGRGDPRHPGFRQRLAHVVHLEGLDDGHDHLHHVVSMSRARSIPALVPAVAGSQL